MATPWVGPVGDWWVGTARSLGHGAITTLAMTDEEKAAVLARPCRTMGFPLHVDDTREQREAEG